MYYFYILESRSDRKFYYGSTNDLRRRIKQHLNGDVLSTKARLPLELVYYEAYNHLELARKREQQVKRSGSIRTTLHQRITLANKGPARPPAGKPGH